MDDQEKIIEEQTENSAADRESASEPEKKGGFKVWWQNHKPSKRRLIQVYAALLYNVNFKGFFTGRIYTGGVKGMCVPGLNCYSCPGASGACPLGSLQNALAHRSAETPNALFYMIGILLLFGVLLGRTICGFLCPVGLGQELLYKIKTPKVKKSRVTYILSYLKYVLLAVLVIAVPLLFGMQSSTVVPGFCKYICPAGTFGGAIGLLLHPNNTDLFGMLGVLFTWKFVLMVAIIALCVFIYRFFCRFFCPLGAIYGFFNKISMIGIGLDKNKCTDCGLCIAHCKMDVKHVGDHECINCGECISVCPAKAISWKGSKLLLHRNAVEAVGEPAEEEKPLSDLLAAKASEEQVASASIAQEKTAREEIALASISETREENAPSCTPETAEKSLEEKKPKKKRGREFYFEVTAWTLALAVFTGAFVYYNFIDKVEAATVSSVGVENSFSVTLLSGSEKSFKIYKDSSEGLQKIKPTSGDGTEESPYLVSQIVGEFEPSFSVGQTVYYRYRFEPSEEQPDYQFGPYTYSSAGDLKFEAYYEKHDGEKLSLAVIEGAKTENFELVKQGYHEGELLYGFDLEVVGSGGEKQTLTEHYGKVTVINFWYTVCGPCVAELPLFQELAAKYKDQVDMVAIHKAAEEDAEIEDFLVSMGWKEWDISFLHDTGNIRLSETYALYGGKDSYPMTVIIDRNGFVTCHHQGPIAQDLLEEQIQEALKR